MISCPQGFTCLGLLKLDKLSRNLSSKVFVRSDVMSEAQTLKSNAVTSPA